jgi:hypothetical protein
MRGCPEVLLIPGKEISIVSEVGSSIQIFDGLDVHG